MPLMYLRILVIIECYFLISGCQNKSENIRNIDSTVPGFEQLKGVDVITDSVFRPTTMNLIDSLLLMRELNNDKLFSLYNIIENTYINQIIGFGNGPFEMLGAEYLGKLKDFVWFYDITNNKIVQFKLDHYGFIPFKEIQIEAMDYHMVEPKVISPSMIISSCFSNTKARIIQYDTMRDSFKILYNFEVLPEHKNTPDHIHNLAFHSILTIKPDKSKIFMAGKNSDLIEIYSLTSKNKTLFRSHGGIDPVYKIAETDNGSFLSWTNQMPFCYSGITSNDQYVYCLYSGRKLEDGGEAHFGKQLYMFDWKGNLKRKFILENPCNEIAITDRNELISLERKNDRDIIRKYRMPE